MNSQAQIANENFARPAGAQLSGGMQGKNVKQFIAEAPTDGIDSYEGPRSDETLAPSFGSSRVMATSDDLTDAKIALSEAKTDTKFAQLIGEVRLSASDLKTEFGKVNARMDGLERSTTGVKATIIIAAFTVIAVLIGVLTYGQTWFGLGVTLRDVIRATVIETTQHQAPTPPSQ